MITLRFSGAKARPRHSSRESEKNPDVEGKENVMEYLGHVKSHLGGQGKYLWSWSEVF